MSKWKKPLSAGAGLLATLTLSSVMAGPASAATEPLSRPRVLVSYDLAAGEQPENVLVEPSGDLIVALSRAGKIERVTPKGARQTLATLPKPADGGKNAPVLGFSLITGLARTHDGTLFVGYVTGDAALTGIWRIQPGHKPHRIAALPATSFPNGMGLDARTGKLYVADSALGIIWQLRTSGGPITKWVDSTELDREDLLGANGLKVHNGAVWVSNSDKGTLLRYPLGHTGRAGKPQVKISGHGFIDDFTFIGRGDTVLAAMDPQNEVALFRPDGTATTVLTAADGLQGPTSIAVSRHTVYVMSASFVTNKDPNILVADLDRAR
ncbi:SMP-30/gluconolactonase/LRE family protein [Streptomyces sp. NPDC021080]|uniref:SMP-30/gluconolactonase/LRE family protein n=1 Tax=Streptomyces sp. NPDC021080 TaxID=3365110 RepID=UPI0037A8EB5D